MRLKYLFMTFIILFAVAVRINAQGCSDAGACTVESFKHSNEDDLNNFTEDYLSITISNGKGDLDIAYYTASLGYSKLIVPEFRLSAFLNMNIIKGELEGKSGLSDVFLTGDYQFENSMTATLGIKIPLNRADDPFFIDHSPMNYQISLGTYDLIAGLSYRIEALFLSAAVQYPLIQNKNEYTGWYLVSSTNKFKRQGDFIGRISYTFDLFNDKLSFIPGLLPIIHLGNDKITDPSGIEKEIDGSGGLTLNLTSYFIYHLKENSIELGVGVPLKTRKARPEGLTRKYVVSLGFKFLI